MKRKFLFLTLLMSIFCICGSLFTTENSKIIDTHAEVNTAHFVGFASSGAYDGNNSTWSSSSAFKCTYLKFDIPIWNAGAQDDRLASVIVNGSAYSHGDGVHFKWCAQSDTSDTSVLQLIYSNSDFLKPVNGSYPITTMVIETGSNPFVNIEKTTLYLNGNTGKWSTEYPEAISFKEIRSDRNNSPNSVVSGFFTLGLKYNVSTPLPNNGTDITPFISDKIKINGVTLTPITPGNNDTYPMRFWVRGAASWASQEDEILCLMHSAYILRAQTADPTTGYVTVEIQDFALDGFHFAGITLYFIPELGTYTVTNPYTSFVGIREDRKGETFDLIPSFKAIGLLYNVSEDLPQDSHEFTGKLNGKVKINGVAQDNIVQFWIRGNGWGSYGNEVLVLLNNAFLGASQAIDSSTGYSTLTIDDFTLVSSVNNKCYRFQGCELYLNNGTYSTIKPVEQLTFKSIKKNMVNEGYWTNFQIEFNEDLINPDLQSGAPDFTALFADNITVNGLPLVNTSSSFFHIFISANDQGFGCSKNTLTLLINSSFIDVYFPYNEDNVSHLHIQTFNVGKSIVPTMDFYRIPNTPEFFSTNIQGNEMEFVGLFDNMTLHSDYWYVIGLELDRDFRLLDTNYEFIDTFVPHISVNDGPYFSNNQDLTHLWISNNDLGFGCKANRIVIMIRKDAVNLFFPLVNGYSTLKIESFKFSGMIIPEITLYRAGTDGAEWIIGTPLTNVQTNKNATYRDVGDGHNGLEFTTKIVKSYFEDQLSTYGDDNIATGTFIISEQSYVESSSSNINDYFSKVSQSSKTFVEVINYANDFTDEDESFYTFSASLTNIKDKNIDKRFAGVGYVKNKITGEFTYGLSIPSFISIYELALELQGQGKSSDIYLDKMLSLSTTNKSYELVNNSQNNVDFTYENRGFYKITASSETNLYSVVIDGETYELNLQKGQSKYISFVNNQFEIKDNVDLEFGIDEPCKELWNANGAQSNYATYQNNSEMSHLFDAKTERLWISPVGLLHGIDSPDPLAFYSDTGLDDVVFDANYVQNVHNSISNFKNKGVSKVVMLISGFIYSRADKIYYDTVDKQFVSFWTQLTTGHSCNGGAGIIPDQTENDYEIFLNNQRKFYNALFDEFGTEIDGIEFMNESDINGNEYYYENIVNLSQVTTPTTDRLAKWTMDMCKLVTDTVKEKELNIKVFTPAFGCVGSDSNAHHVSSLSLLEDQYAYIQSQNGNPKDYFQMLNLHPYIFLSKQMGGNECAYFYESNPKNSQLNANRVTDWVNVIDNMHNVCVENDDEYLPVYITEFGLTDLGNTTDTNWKGFNSSDVLATTLQQCLANLSNLEYLQSFMQFRLFDWSVPAGGFVDSYEPNLGIINEDKTLKQTAKVLYSFLHNGSTDYSPLTSALANM